MERNRTLPDWTDAVRHAWAASLLAAEYAAGQGGFIAGDPPMKRYLLNRANRALKRAEQSLFRCETRDSGAQAVIDSARAVVLAAEDNDRRRAVEALGDALVHVARIERYLECSLTRPRGEA